MLTPLDIQNKEFRRSLRGYHEQDVDEFLDEIVRSVEGTVRENASLRDQVSRLEERLGHYARIEEVLKRTLISAEEAAGDMRTSAQREAELVVREAKEQARRDLEAADKAAASVREELVRFRHAYRNFLSRIKAEMRGQIEAIESLQSVEALDAQSVPEPGR